MLTPGPRRSSTKAAAAIAVATLTLFAGCGDDDDLPERRGDPEGDEIVPGEGGPVD